MVPVLVPLLGCVRFTDHHFITVSKVENTVRAGVTDQQETTGRCLSGRHWGSSESRQAPLWRQSPPGEDRGSAPCFLNWRTHHPKGRRKKHVDIQYTYPTHTKGPQICFSTFHMSFYCKYFSTSVIQTCCNYIIQYFSFIHFQAKKIEPWFWLMLSNNPILLLLMHLFLSSYIHSVTDTHTHLLSPLLHLLLPPGRYQCQRGWWEGGACDRPWREHWPPPHNAETPPHLGDDIWAAEIQHNTLDSPFYTPHCIDGKHYHQDPESVSVWQSDTHRPMYRLISAMLLSDSSPHWNAILATYWPECREYAVHNGSLFRQTHIHTHSEHHTD